MWKKLKEFEGLKIAKGHMINEDGDIISPEGKMRKHNIKPDGYHIISIKLANGGRKNFYIHRLVYSTFVNKETKGYVINHGDFNTHNNNVNNLTLCTQKENINYSIYHNRIKVKGEENSTSKLSEKQVHNICKLLEGGMKIDNIIETLNLNHLKTIRSAIEKISSGVNWKHISEQYQLPKRKRKSMNTHVHLVEEVCILIAKGYEFNKIANKLTVDISTKNEYDKFYKFFKRIKNKKSYTNISDKYF